MKNISIAVDGPSGAGKSTLARAIASKYKFIYVDTGAIYRTVGLAAQYAKVDSKDIEGVIAILPDVKIEMCYDDEGVQRMLLGGKDVSAEIRTPLSSIYASDVSAIPEVRAFLMDMQRDMAKKYSVIMDGRDIGTVVLPDADVKIFLTADARARAQRRFLELEKKGIPTPYDEVLRDIEYRDAQDSSRAAAPLKAADDAVVLDNTNLSFDESVEAACRIIEEKAGL
ncbi:MAG: (d)CMP kinase [Oscillospiraceae bacterium]|nr:(d)CMP kinase [Oscillospiraceae bacterium]